MKEKILEIIIQHKFDHISSEQAVSELLDLFDVSNSENEDATIANVINYLKSFKKKQYNG